MQTRGGEGRWVERDKTFEMTAPHTKEVSGRCVKNKARPKIEVSGFFDISNFVPAEPASYNGGPCLLIRLTGGKIFRKK